MLIKTISVGQLETNCYVVTDETSLDCAVIDPGDESNTILDYLEQNRLRCRSVLLTHGHFDHVGAVEALAEETGARVYLNREDDAETRRDLHFPLHLPENGEYYADGDRVEIGSLRFEVIGTPGHTPGGVTLRCQDALFTGDTLFRGSCGRTDLPGGDTEELLRSLKRICSLEGDFEVYPGHMDCSTLARERLFNYYCRLAANS